MFLDENNNFDYDKLKSISQIVTKNLNKIIDVNFYPVPEAEYSNKNTARIGIGVQGSADVFAKMGIAFDSEDAKDVNRKIFETIYFGSLTESAEIAKKRTPLMKEYKELLIRERKVSGRDLLGNSI